MPLLQQSDDRELSSDDRKAHTAVDAFSVAIILLAIAAAIYCAALTIRAYVPCPWLDEWRVVADIADGASPLSWAWLWSQHGEHRIAIVRLLIWLDYAVFGAKNYSLFVEMYCIQAAHLFTICYCIERFSDLPKPLRRMLQGVYALCLFHPFQAQNFTWAFQVSFFLPFAIGNGALLAVAHFERFPRRWRTVAVLGIGIAPLLAALNLASGLLFGPAATALAFAKGLPRKFVVTLGTLSALEIAAYACGYRTPANHPPPLQALLRPLDILQYVLKLLNTSWQSFYIAPVSFAVLAACIVVAARRRERVSDLEWFCFAECGLVLATGVLVACGRLQYGITQAGEGRYQTFAVLYWAALFSLVLIALRRRNLENFRLAQFAIVLLAIIPTLSLPGLWRYYAGVSDQNRQSCIAVMRGRYAASDLKRLDFFANHPADEVRRGRALLRNQWRRQP